MVRRWFITGVILLSGAGVLVAQDQGSDDNGFIVSLIEEQLSTDRLKIRLSGINGLLSSEATVDRITISDPEGTWLTVENARIDWNRSALFRGALDIKTLAAEKIDIPRGPAPEEGLPEPEATQFSLPELPVSVSLGALSVDSIVLGEALAGTEAEISVKGSASIDGETIAAALDIDRMDFPGGSLAFAVDYSDATGLLKLDLEAREPQGGLVSTTLGLEGEPSLDLAVKAEGPISDVQAVLALRIDDEPLVDGTLQVASDAGATRYGLDLNGRLAQIVPPAFEAFFAGESTIEGALIANADGAIAVPELRIESGGLRLNGQGSTTGDGFLESLELTAELGRGDAERLVLPFGEGDTSVQAANLLLSYGADRNWGGQVTASDLRASDVWIDSVGIDIAGTTEGVFTPGTRGVAATLTGRATGLSSPDRRLREALGDEVLLDLAVDWSEGNPIRLETGRLQGALGHVELQGDLVGTEFTGRFALQTDNIATLSAVTGRDMGGAVAFEAKGSVDPLTGGFDVAFDGTSRDLRIGAPAFDRAVAGETTLSGGARRDETGIVARDLVLESAQASVTIDGTYSTDATDMRLSAVVPELSAISGKGSGDLALSAGVSGGPDRTDVTIKADMANGTLQGRDVEQLSIGFTGSGPRLARLQGELSGRGLYGGEPLDLAGRLELSDHVNVLKGFELDLLGAQFRGTVGQGGDGLLAGNLTVAAEDIAPLAGLALLDAQGAIDAKVQLSRNGKRQLLEFVGSLGNMAVAGAEVADADVDLRIADLFGVPLFDGDAVLTRVRVAGFELDEATLQAETEEDRTSLDLSAVLSNGTRVLAAGGLANLDPGVEVRLSRLDASNDEIALSLDAPTILSVVDDNIGLSEAAFRVGEGQAVLTASVAQEISANIALTDLPLGAADLFLPGLALDGRLTGRIDVSGNLEDPDVVSGLSGTGLTARELEDLGLPALDIDVTTSGALSLLDVDAVIRSGDDFDVTVTGQVPSDLNEATTDLKVVLRRLDLALVDPLAGDLGLAGMVSGTGDVSGVLAAPEVAFDLAGTGVTTAAIRGSGVPPLTARVGGRYGEFTVDLDDVSVTGGGIDFRATGTVPLFSDGLDVRASGTLPLSLVNIPLAESGVQAQGRVTLDGVAGGRLDAPALSGSVVIPDGSLALAAANLRLDGLDIALLLDGQTVRVQRANARVASGGTLSLGGSLDLTEGLPADLVLTMRDVTYSDGRIVTTRFSGQIDLDGPLQGGGAISGGIDVGRTEFTVPKRFGINEGVLLDVEHRNAPRNVRLTLDRADVASLAEDRDASTASALSTNIRISAPNQIFVRGRGLDAELGGRLELRGTTADLVPVGSLELIRGRLSILGQRFDFDEGSIVLIGSFDPRLRFVAETEAAEGTVVTITVIGPASDPEILFSSDPELPQDEVLALLIFSRNVSELSPLQVAQLASAAATLAGSGGPGVTESLRAATGLANFDVTSDEDGGLGVRAGAYLSENVYLDVEAGSNGESRATINLDLSDSVRARTSVDSNGESSVGIFWERDY